MYVDDSRFSDVKLSIDTIEKKRLLYNRGMNFIPPYTKRQPLAYKLGIKKAGIPPRKLGIKKAANLCRKRGTEKRRRLSAPAYR